MSSPSDLNKTVLLPKAGIDLLVEDLNKQFAVVLRGNTVYIMRWWTDEKGVKQLRFLDRKSFELLLANKTYSHGQTSLPLSKLWIQHRDRKEYDDVYFFPGDTPVNSRSFNLWSGFSYNPIVPSESFTSWDGQKAPLSCKPWLDSVYENICSKDLEIFKWVIGFIADLFQKPHRKLGVALIMRGEMGVGKGTLVFPLGKLFGSHYLPITQSSQLIGRFNFHLAGKVLIFVDEGGWSQDKHGAGTLRAIITEQELTLEGKHRDAASIESHAHIIAAANADFVVPTGLDDERRMAVVDVSSQHRQDREYFKPIYDSFTPQMLSELLWYLKQYEYDEAKIRIIPKTKALLDQKVFSLTLEAEWLKTCLEDGEIVYTSPEGNTVIAPLYRFEEINDHKNNRIELKKLYSSYLHFASTMRKPIIVRSAWTKEIYKFIPVEKKRDSRIDDGAFLPWPSLEELRKLFDKKMGHEMNWENQ